MCSVLFCDLVGFTALSETRDPEEVRELLSRYFDTARTVIDRYGGVIEKFIGDAVMAVWGAPVAAETDAERAVRAALDVVAAVGQLGIDLGVPELAARAGVVTGEVAVTLGATGEGMVAGDAVNTASRVQAAAGRGTVLVDAATRRLASTAVGFEDAGEFHLKGKVEPEQLWLAVRVLAGLGGSQRVDGLEAPLTGRDPELRTMKELFHAAAERRVPRLVVVSGPAGVGKSRLGWEFEKYIDGVADVVLWHRGRCLSYGEGVAFSALVEIVRQRFGIADEDPVDVAARKLADGVAQFVPDPEERVYVGARLGRLLGLPFGDDDGAVLGRDELFAGWRLFFERLASTHPVVLLIEDAHYADAGLLDFCEHLVDWARDLPIFVLVFGRPEVEARRPRFGTGRNRTTLTIDPLDSTSMDRLVDALVPGMPAEARNAITSQAQGIPLFAVETVRSLVDQDIVVPREGVYRLVGDVGRLAVPDSLHSLLAARLDALEPVARDLIADAAVLGSSFPLEALVAISGKSEAQVRTALADLLQREVLEVSADKLSPQRGTYRFAQEMLRQVAYDTISRRDRKARHLVVAAHLRATFPSDGDEMIAVVARHYLDALAAVPDDPDVPELRELAIAALVRAGERSQRAGAQAPAGVSYAAAAACIEEQSGAREGSVTAAQMYERAAEAAILAIAYDDAIDRAGKARQLHLAAGDVRAAARLQSTAGRALRRSGRFTEAREQLTEALAVLRPDADPDTIRALVELATIEVFGGGAHAQTFSAEAVALGEALDVEAGLMSRLFTIRGLAHAFSGSRPQAIAYLRESTRLAEKGNDIGSLARSFLNLADVLAVTDPQASAEAARTAAEHGRRHGDREMLAVATANLAGAMLLMGDWDQADQVLIDVGEEGLDDHPYIAAYRAILSALKGDVEGATMRLPIVLPLRESEDQQDQATIALVEAFTCAARAEPVDALRLSRDIIGRIDALGVGAEAIRWAWPLSVRMAAELGDADAVRDLVAVVDAFPRGHVPPVVRAERDLAVARLAADGADPNAGELFTNAVAGLRALASPYYLASGLLDHAEFLRTHNDAAAAAELIDEARTIGTALRAQPIVDRVSRLDRQSAVHS
ncbi:MAG TPA: adenylate/guanylate cyclase domain-containing protein [Acidothermaceae bacterium]